jgi:hypothetical protein
MEVSKQNYQIDISWWKPGGGSFFVPGMILCSRHALCVCARASVCVCVSMPVRPHSSFEETPTIW